MADTDGTSPPPNPAPESNTAAETATKTVDGWKELAPMGKPRSFGGGIFLNDHRFLMIGGTLGVSNDGVSSCECYDTNSETWSDLPIDMPNGRVAFGVARVGDRVYVMGGCEKVEGDARSDLISIDLSGDDLSFPGRKWETLAPMPVILHFFTCVSHQNFIYVFGGLNNDSGNALDTAKRYNIENDEWTSLPSMPGSARYSAAAGVVGNRIFVVGGGNNNGTLKSTIVFDVLKQQWEPLNNASSNDPASPPPVPDKKISVLFHSVVVVERFVIVIPSDDERESQLIEVLDTQRNVWNSSQVRNIVEGGHAVGFSEATNEIIVAGGGDNKTVKSIPFETLLPPAFRLKERGQKLEGDTERGPDKLGLKIIAEVLAENLIFRDLTPPFVLAVLGKWGWGKSYLFNLMEEYIIKIQKKPADEFLRETFAGHVYVVKFDAWTFARGECIWSSIMYKILKDLNEQLQFEEIISKTNNLKGKTISTLEVFRDFSTQEVQYLQETYDEDFFEKYQSILNNSDTPSKSLLKAINVSNEYDEKKIEKLTVEIKKDEKNIKKIEDENRKIDLEKALSEAVRNHAKAALCALCDIGEFVTLEIDSKAFDDIRDLKKIIDHWKKKHWWNYKFEVKKIPPVAFMSMALFIVLAVFLFANGKAIVAAASTIISPVIPVITNISSTLQKVDPLIEKLRTRATKLKEEEDIETGIVNTTSCDEKKKILEKKKQRKEVLENRSSFLKGSTLREVAASINIDSYQKTFGIVHKVHKDLQLISDAMLNNRQTKNFPRGDPRIILFVDDLDRCDQVAVVKVIEALQLLVKTKLFVAVLAIDPRYVTSSLEKVYDGILDPKIPPTGMDFIEKIIQIPFRLPGVGQNNVDFFVDSQIDVMVSRESSNKVERVEETPNAASRIDSSDGLGSEPLVDRQDPDKPQLESEGDPLPSNKISFTEKEGIMIKETLRVFGAGPRCMKRIINVFKVLQVIWKRDTYGRFEVDHAIKRATLFLMLLASEESTRIAAYAIFEWMVLGVVKYHHVMCDGEGEWRKENDLANLFKTELRKQYKSFNVSPSKKAKNEGFFMNYVDDYLSEYKWTSIKEWQEVSSKFMLARCFSFYRLVADENNIQDNRALNLSQERMARDERERMQEPKETPVDS